MGFHARIFTIAGLVGLAAGPIVAAMTATSAHAQAANQCVQVNNTSRTAFFKSRIVNRCSQPVHVSYCERALCGGPRFYNSSVTLQPGGSAAADTRGQGIRYAVCIAGPRKWPPRANASGNFTCPG